MTIKRGLLASSLVLALLVAVTVGVATLAAPATNVGSAVRSLGMFSDSKWTVHYRVPTDDQIELLLEDKGISLAGPEAKATAVQTFRQEWASATPPPRTPRNLRSC